MAIARCDQCNAEEYMPFVCKFCRGRYCVSHRLPENHACAGLENYRERVRSEGRIVAPEPGSPMQPQLSAGARLSAGVNSAFDRIRGKAAYTMLAIMGGTFLVQLALRSFGLWYVEDYLFILDRTFYLKPWTVITSVFAHAGFMHIFLNGLILYFFGPTLERLIGSKRFTYLFLAGGAIAGLLQIFVFSYLLSINVLGGVLGASGAILALLGCLTVLAPRITVLVFFIIPAPLWAITAFYALYDIVFLFDTSSGIARVAHLAGLAVGLYYGKRLHDMGIRAHIQQQPSMSRRPF